MRAGPWSVARMGGPATGFDLVVPSRSNIYIIPNYLFFQEVKVKIFPSRREPEPVAGLSEESF